MRLIVGFMFLFGVTLSWILIKFDFSDTIKAAILSFIFGIIIFILVSGLVDSNLTNKADKNKDTEEKRKKRKKTANTIGIIFMIISIILFFNFYFYIKSMLGNDLLVSLDVENDHLAIKNGEDIQINVKARVLNNPFCSANCSLILEDLSEGNLLFYDNIYIKVSSPLSREYIINSNEEKVGQKLYKVSLECDTIKERLCYTKTPSSKLRTKIISVDYDLNDVQKLIKSSLKDQTEILISEFYTLQNILNSMDFIIPYLDLSDLKEEHDSIGNSLFLLTPDINNLNNLYLSQDYSKLGTDIYPVGTKLINLTNLVSQLNYSFFNNISFYNSLIENISLMREEILYLEEYHFSNSSILAGESFVRDFNSMILNMKNKETIGDKVERFNSIIIEREDLLSILENESKNNISGDNLIQVSVSPVIFSKILIEEKSYVNYFTLNEPSPICCLNGECYNCISDSSLNYPVVLVHGHSFNEKLSAELSMESFSEMARKLEKEGYLDAGYFYGSKYDESSGGYLGKVNASVVIEATYYIDTLITEEDSFIFDSKWESIDTYASRLNEVVSNVKYLTGKDKVILVAHSMGGLVTRRYVQLYGEDSLDRLILVGIPNHGVDGFVLNYCSVFGADLECGEMNKSSLFLKELNSASLPNIPIYNIIGLGCIWEGANGDGIVKNESAYLENAENIYVNGTCSGVDFFHVNMIKPNKYPEIYELVKGLIEKR